MKTKSSVHIPFIVILLSLILGSIVVQSAVLCTGFLKSMHSNSKENVIEISKLGTEKLSTEIENMLLPYSEIVKIARDYIESVGGFEKFAEWGLF